MVIPSATVSLNQVMFGREGGYAAWKTLEAGLQSFRHYKEE